MNEKFTIKVSITVVVFTMTDNQQLFNRVTTEISV